MQAQDQVTGSQTSIKSRNSQVQVMSKYTSSKSKSMSLTALRTSKNNVNVCMPSFIWPNAPGRRYGES